MFATLSMIFNALVPVAFVILLGVFAGRSGLISPKRSDVLAALALDFCLPALLFTQTAKMTLQELTNWQFFTGIAIGLLSIYIVTLVISLTLFRKSLAVSSMQALNSSFPNMAFMGVPILTAVIGSTAVLSVVIGNLISSFVLLPLTLTLLEAGSSGQAKKHDASLVWSSIFSAVKKPLVWAPLAGIVLAVAQIPLPSLGQKSFELIGTATSGVALFALGLVLCGQKLHVGVSSAVNIAFKIVAQPLVMWALAILLGVRGVYCREMILLGALPTASMAAMFAVEYKVYQEESDATILLSTVLSVITLGLCIALTSGMTEG